MMIRRSGRLAIVPLLVLLGTACAQQGGATGAGKPDAAAPSYPADALVFRMGQVGGFVTPAALASRLPEVSVYGDGRVIVQGPVTLAYPGPALPNLRVGSIAAAEVENLVALAREHGVDGGTDVGSPSVADAPSTSFTLLGANGVEHLEVPALGEATDAVGGLTPDQRSARAELRTFVESLTSPSGPLAAVQGEQARPYLPTVVAAVAEAWVPDGAVGGQPEVRWPGPTLPGDELTANLGLGCVTVTGDGVRTVLAAAADANAATPWTSDGRRWRLTLRPLLPDETDCRDLADNR
ncbi:hypothetical protein [Micromonospora cathayae]|uniref:Uncharacterized protein n=1 Tax=Micromonospora cathayae TaxID=3028804 RepID=A0ABY7ZLA6_9ACTN|nr:hypothetical protein [Micromonospora sp. HUAS 3]WDZ83725.1 hypothetical protein PVK37_25165 [Micromonospora sp. HUAS 3]